MRIPEGNHADLGQIRMDTLKIYQRKQTFCIPGKGIAAAFGEKNGVCLGGNIVFAVHCVCNLPAEAQRKTVALAADHFHVIPFSGAHHKGAADGGHNKIFYRKHKHHQGEYIINSKEINIYTERNIVFVKPVAFLPLLAAKAESIMVL